MLKHCGGTSKAIRKKSYHCCIAIVVAPSFTKYADDYVTESPYPIKLSKVNDKENEIVKDLEDFVT